MADTVVLTASAGTFAGLVEALKEVPVAVEERPLLSFGPPSDWGPLDAALNRLNEYGTIAFTSRRAARAFAARMQARGMSWAGGEGMPAIWAVGPATAAELGEVLGSVRVPGRGGTAKLGAAEVLVRTMIEEEVSGPVLFPCGDVRRDELPRELRKRGIEVNEVVCYRSVLADESQARTAAARGTVLVVASPSVADLLARACPRASRPELLAVGPTTAASARAAGWSPAAVANEPTVRALSSAILDLLAHR
jgi:uroporphyrinogen III methyltransferase / synthase